MKSFKRLGLILSAVVFSLTIAASSSFAQPGKAKYEGNNGNHRGWTQGKHKGWEKRDDRAERRINRGYNNGRINSDEYRRLQRRGNRLQRVQNRYSRDGYVSTTERRRLNRKYTRYNRQINRARRNQ